MEEARVSMASEPGKVRLINKAEKADKPISPDIPRNIIMALIIGALFGFGCSIIIEYFDNTVKSVDFIERKKLPVLAIIPSINQGPQTYSKGNSTIKTRMQSGWKSARTIQRRLITHEDPKSPISEAYRSLRTSLMYSRQKEGANIILVIAKKSSSIHW